MEQVFDLREFMLMLFKKGKNVLIVGVVLGVLGAGFGWMRFPNEDKIMSTSTASISLVDKMQDATALNNAMIMTNAYLVSDTFYTEMLGELSKNLDNESLKKLFGGDSTPKLDDIKDVLKIQTKGNITIVDVTATDKELPKIASELCIGYIVDSMPKFNENLEARRLGNEVLNVTTQNNDSAMKEAIKFGILGLGGGIVLSVLVIFFVDVFNLKLKNPEQLMRTKYAVLAQGSDRAVAVIKKTIGEKPLSITLSSTAGVDILAIAQELKAAFARIGDEVSVVDCTNKTAKEAATSEQLQGAIICCDNINESTAAMYYTAKTSGVVLCEKIKLSQTDMIEKAATQATDLGIEVIGIYIA